MFLRLTRFHLLALSLLSALPSLAQPKATDTSGYTLVWSDEFNTDGPPDPSSWRFEKGFVRNKEAQWYQEENAFCKDGNLIIEGRKTPNPDRPYTSSSINTKGLHSWQYGRFIMRGRIDISHGLWPAWWTLGDTGHWPANGEIDIMEYYRNKLLANVACLGSDKKAEWYSKTRPVDSMGGEKWSSQFHIWRMDWDEEAIALYVDDILLNKVALKDLVNKDGSGFNPFKQPHYMLLNLAMGGQNGGEITPDTKFPNRFEVDYVRVYRKKAPRQFTRTATGGKATVNDIDIEIQFYSPSMARIIKSPQDRIFKKESLSVIKQPQSTRFTVREQGDTVTLSTDSLQVQLNLNTGKIQFKDPAGLSLLTEKDYGTQFSPITDVNKPTFIVRQAFLLDKNEPIYGLGQQQNGKLNQRGQRIFLRQDNMKICIPFFQSFKGYGLFWDNYSPTDFTDNPQETAFESQVGDGADYYFLYGGGGDQVVARLRDLTGQAPLMPLWVYGFNQSRERYKTQYELMDVVKKYRSLHIPLDGIIQDWQYWGRDSNWNAMRFDPATYPNPKSMVDSVHQLNAHLFIVAWPGFGPLTEQYAAFKPKQMLLDFETWPPNSGARPYDVYNPAARDIYWEFLNKGVFSLGTDGWWLDSSEPDHVNLKEKDFDLSTALGTFRSVRNAFPLEHIRGVYEHQRQTTNEKRVTILTRSAFAGQQRFGACNWSGDVVSTWQVFRRQIPAGLNLSLSGIPYWNTDIGGFFAGAFVKGGGAKNPDFQELYTRWLQFAAFTPMMRSHGTDIPREIYQFGQRGDWPFDVQEKFINLRYHLLPYLYSTAWDVTAHAGSMMRALYLDFPHDKVSLDIDNEYMFGKSFLVSPVTEKGAKEQSVYLPAGADWYDYWTNELLKGGTTQNRQTPMDIMPLYVKAGSILPWGPTVQYAAEKKWDNLELRIYPGADAAFTLYEDENDSYNYEKGSYSEITFRWNENARTLTIGPRRGSFPAMLKSRKFNIVLNKLHKTISYRGEPVTFKL